jgi:DNA-binding IscR family transcriptional regulator
VDGTDTRDIVAANAAAGQDLASLFAWVKAHPARTAAVRALAARMMDLFADDPRLADVLKDAGRYVAAMLAFLLDETGGLTLPRLRAACASSGLLSPGRARAVFRRLEQVGYVERREGAGGAYALTPAFRAAWRRQLRAALEAALPIEPSLARLLDDPAALDAFGRAHAAGLLEAMRGGGEPPLFLQVFQHSHAGSQILWALILAAGEADDFAPERVGPISISALARRFGVSRIHVTRIFRNAERHGLGGLEPDGMIWFAQEAREQMRMLFTFQLAHILAAAGQAAGEADQRAADGQKCAVAALRFGD